MPRGPKLYEPDFQVLNRFFNMGNPGGFELSPEEAAHMGASSDKESLVLEE